MKERKTKIIVTVMTLSVIALIVLQIYWIKNLLKIEEERFERSVNIALMNAAEKIEKEEAAKLVVKKIAGDNNEIVVLVRGDKSNPNKIIDRRNEQVKIVRLDSSRSGNYNFRVTYSGREKDKKILQNVYEQHVYQKPPNGSPLKWRTKIDTVNLKHDQLVHNVVTELVSESKTKKIEDRISRKQLDSLLRREFLNSGINADFYFGVDKITDRKLTLVKTGADTTQLKETNFKTLLFPRELFLNPNELLVYFPQKDTFIFASVAGMLGFSIFLVLVIAGVFIKTLQMFIRQKKITDIKNDLINNITHEFKTPISTISIACEALNEPALIKEQSSLNKYTSIIREENERLSMMVENLLTTAALESTDQKDLENSIRLMKEKIALDDIINSSIKKFDEILRQRKGKIILNNFPSNIFIYGDSFHLSNIFANLIDNAIKYNENEPIINIHIRKNDNNVFVEIEDNGIGIAKEHHKKIFEVFYRVPTGNIQNVRGNGIGLNYVKKILEAHGGKIEITNSSDNGSTFEISLPIQE